MTDKTHTQDPENIAPPRAPHNPLTYIADKTQALRESGKTYLYFEDFLSEWPDADLSDPQVVSDQMVQQANLLNKLSQYLLIRGSREFYPLAFKAQRLMQQSLAHIIKVDSSSGHDDS